MDSAEEMNVGSVSDRVLTCTLGADPEGEPCDADFHGLAI
jgi:hypothetical protein